MARHKQCQQKLGESRNTDLTAPQGVTRQTFIDTYVGSTTQLLQREGGQVTKLL